jgi:cation transport regulator ChaC
MTLKDLIAPCICGAFAGFARPFLLKVFAGRGLSAAPALVLMLTPCVVRQNAISFRAVRLGYLCFLEKFWSLSKC